MSVADYSTLPTDLPVPRDDGACDHLLEMRVPDLTLASTSGGAVNLAAIAGRVVVYCYPMTGTPGVPLPEGWDQIPGARGCTPESCRFRDHFQQLAALGAQVFGLSTQSIEVQKEAAARLRLPFELLSDADLRFTRALNLPTFEAAGIPRIKRLTLVFEDAVIRKVFYPIFPPDRHAAEVVSWLERA